MSMFSSPWATTPLIKDAFAESKIQRLEDKVEHLVKELKRKDEMIAVLRSRVDYVEAEWLTQEARITELEKTD